MGDSSTLHSSVLERIGNTSLLALRNLRPKDYARLLIKLATENPTGSMKDRMALAMVETAERDGRLKPSGRVVEYTGGSTGVSLALMCRVKGHPLSIVTSDAFSDEKRHHMAALGAELTVIPSVEGGMNEALTRHMIDAARQMAQRTGGFWTDQRHNPDQLSAYRAMGEELWRQTGGRVDACVQRVGTAASLRGVAETLRQHQADVQIVAVEPRESAVLSGEPTGVHNIEGVGAGFVVPLWEPSLVSEIARVSTEEAMAMVRRLAREEALLAGTSTGGNLVAALDIAKRLGPKATVVTVMVDAGMKYLSTPLYKNSQYMPCP